MSFTEWNNRPIELRTLFNPSFCGVVLLSAIESYQKESTKGMPIPLAFLILPLVLHSKTRSSLPRSKKSNLGLWCKENENQLLFLSERVNSLNKSTIQALSLLGIGDHIAMNDSLILTKKKMKGVSAYLDTSEEVKEIYNKASSLGKWFANSGESSIVYTYLGVRP